MEINDLGGSYRYRNDFRGYVFLGFAGFRHNPKAQLNGTWYNLRELKTEGQVTPYSSIAKSFPMGFGMYLTIAKKFRLGWDFGYAKTSTDYLDDVSTTYADLSATNDPIAISLANRTNELTDVDPAIAANFAPGAKRGSPKNKDAYLYSTITISKVMRGKSSLYRSHYSRAFKGKKFKKRKVRAKF